MGDDRTSITKVRSFAGLTAQAGVPRQTVTRAMAAGEVRSVLRKRAISWSWWATAAALSRPRDSASTP
ncbi:hypothetical protein ACFQZC_34965 [Streptacidiphilus monticola]